MRSETPSAGQAASEDEKRALQPRWEASDRDMAKAAEESYWGRTSIGAVAALIGEPEAAQLFKGTEGRRTAPAVLLSTITYGLRR